MPSRSKSARPAAPADRVHNVVSRVRAGKRVEERGVMRLTKLSYAVIATLMMQAGCLAIGLWIHYRLVVRSAESTMEAETRGRLADTREFLMPPLQEAMLRETDSVSHAKAEARRPLLDLTNNLPPRKTAAVANVEVLIVDDQWRIVAEAKLNADDHADWTGDEVLSWRAAEFGNDSDANTRVGWLETPSGARMASAYALANGKRWAVFYAPEMKSKLDAAAFFKTLPSAGILAFCWIGGLQGAVVCVMLMRMERRQTDTQTKSDAEARRRSQDLVRTREAVIFGLARLAESRDRATGDHLERIALFSSRLAAVLRHYPKYREVVTPSFIRLIGVSSSLHDVGKVGIEDSILLKPGQLTREERKRMQDHPAIGGDCLKSMEQRLGNSNFLQMAREITVCHHERWDGKGYPNGLAGEQIPLTARIVAIADVYDALSSRRVYKEAFDRRQCAQKIEEQAGRQFDPDLVKVFLEIEPEFWRIALQHRDHEPSASLPIRNDRPEVCENTDSDSSDSPKTGIEATRVEETVDRLESLLTES